MKYPKVIPRAACTIPIRVTLHGEGLNEDGGSVIIYEADLFCNYQSTGKTVLTADKKLVQLSGVAYFHEDFCPDIPDISGGTAKVFGVERTIFQGIKARNPDGTVNYIELRFV